MITPPLERAPELDRTTGSPKRSFTPLPINCAPAHVVAGPDLKRFSRRPGDEPLTGYRLVEPLGVGGFGEVWKCLAPGGLLKALKIVTLPPEAEGHPEATPAERERSAIDRVKDIRHPFLISLDRIDEANGELIIVMELAERSSWHEFEESRRAGERGIPEGQLLRLMMEAAEVLDVMHFRHGLQHLDVKPANLLLSSGHIKLSDFGLVSFIDAQPEVQQALSGCFTPRYASPELLQGNVSRTCDQYSLAIVYQELLTGELPYEGNGLLKRLLKAPDVAALPEIDRPVVTRALAADPRERFPSCIEFVQALLAGRTGMPALHVTSVADRRTARPAELLADPAPPADTSRAGVPVITRSPSLVETPSSPFANGRDAAPEGPITPGGHAAGSNDIIYPPTIHVGDLGWKRDAAPGQTALPFDEFMSRLVASATGKPYLPSAGAPTTYRELAGEVVEDNFVVSAVSAAALQRRFAEIVRDCHAEILVQSERFIVFAVEIAVPFWKLFSSRQHVLKITVKLDGQNWGPSELSKATVRVEPFDPAGPPLDPNVLGVRSVLMQNVRSIMQAAPERRRSERLPCGIGATVFPVLSGWRFGSPIEAKVVDLCTDGIGLVSPEKPSGQQFYLRPAASGPLGESAVLLKVVRHRELAREVWAWGAMLGKV